MVIVDGFVFLDDRNKPGLGAYVYEVLEGKAPVIGIAKSVFANNTSNVVEVFRGESSKPLYVSAVGIDPSVAANHVKRMHGQFRTPTLLKKLDQLTRR